MITPIHCVVPNNHLHRNHYFSGGA